LTYAELARSSEAFSANLADAGVQPRDNVGIVLGNSREFLIAAFGVWRHGAVVVPLNPQLREPEILKCALDCHLRAMILPTRGGSLAQTLRDKGAPLEHVWLCPADRDEWTYRGLAGSPSRLMKCSPGVEITPEWPAIIQYSTGSTGYPKRVTRSHANLIGEFTSVASVMRISSQERVLGVAPFFHSHGLMNSAILTLFAAGTLFIVPTFLPRDVAQLIERARITGFPGVPFMFDLLAEMQDQHDFSSIRFALSAGAPLSEKTVGVFQEKYAIWIRPLYGTTETGVISIRNVHGQDVLAVGKPIPGVELRIVDEQHNPVPAGTAGRVEITSPFAASAYGNTSGNEESHFAGDAFFPGDIGRLSADGELTLCGRHRGFINVGGSKVDPAEVETVLRSLPGVAEAVVFGIPDAAGGEKIKAVVAAPDGVSRLVVRAHCVRYLAEFKHPKIIEVRKELPKSPLGKILRKYLMDEAAGGRPDVVFDPRSGFRPATDNPAAGAQSPDLSTLPPFLRVLAVTDGTVTKSIEAYFWEPVEVEVLAHAHMRSDQDYSDIEILSGEPILRRCVVLRGKITRSAYALAESILVAERVPEEMRRELIEGSKGIGELLRAAKRETYRELSAVRLAEAGEWAIHLGVEKHAAVMMRDYQIHIDGRAAIRIRESFPLLRFQPTAQA
jgi:long-chain acyl-CoA synthetase